MKILQVREKALPVYGGNMVGNKKSWELLLKYRSDLMPDQI
jgi:hypothetical protein